MLNKCVEAQTGRLLNVGEDLSSACCLVPLLARSANQSEGSGAIYDTLI